MILRATLFHVNNEKDLAKCISMWGFKRATRNMYVALAMSISIGWLIFMELVNKACLGAMGSQFNNYSAGDKLTDS